MKALKKEIITNSIKFKRGRAYRKITYFSLFLIITSGAYAEAVVSEKSKRLKNIISYNLPAISDKDITTAIQTELGIRTALSAESISITTNDGIVSLTGTADNLLTKDRVEKLALAVKGVRGVVNQIQVKASEKSDEQIKEDVEKTLLMNPATDSYELEAKVNNGKVTLTGKVDSWAESQLAMLVAKKVDGVREVHNDTEIIYKSNRTDNEIAADIKQQLRYDIRVADAMINVQVNNREVTLSGTVGSASEKIQAQYNAWVAGVKSVNMENLKVDPQADFDALRKDKFIPKTDAQLKEAVADALLFDPRVNSMKVVASVNNREVTLTGIVDNLKAKQAAEEDAKNVVGVQAVKNDITIKQQNTTQNMLKENVDWALVTDPIVEKYEIQTTVNNGKVTLDGNIDTYFEKARAEDIISDLAGVSDIENNLKVKDTYSYLFWYDADPVVLVPKESDAEIKDDIKEQIWWSPFVDAEEVTVEVKNGQAILNGTVDSWGEEASAIENAFEGGAIAVDSNLKIEID